MSPASASLVVYRTSAAELQQLMETLHAAVRTWVLVDNSADQLPEAEARRLATEAHGGTYLPSPANVGFGAGHNLALTLLNDSQSSEPYHLIVNPDIEFHPDVLNQLTQVLEERSDIGWVMPQVRAADSTVQPMCKLLPTPLDLLGRRFLPAFLCRLFGLSQSNYEMKGIADIPSEDVPFLSGCFIYARHSVLQKVGGFDPHYFMYMEDVDLCRRFREHAKLLYWPEVHVTHGHHRGSYHDLRLTMFHVRSAIRYFRTWGWFSDPARDAANVQALRSLRSEVRFAPGAERKSAERVAEPHR